jgi:hypothetical protein
MRLTINDGASTSFGICFSTHFIIVKSPVGGEPPTNLLSDGGRR